MTRCQFCKYSRQGLDADAPCPECGRVPIDALPPLADEPIEYRRSLAVGARFAHTACLLRIGYVIALGTFAAVNLNAFVWILVTGATLIAAVNAFAAFKLTPGGGVPVRAWTRPALRALTLLDLVIALAGGIAFLATRDQNTTSVTIALATGGALLVTAVGRAMTWIAVVGTIAPRLESDRLSRRLNAWFTYAGVTAMTSVAGFIAAGLTALVPILAPITIVLAAPFGAVMLVLTSIAIIGAINLHGTLARELGTAAV